MSKKILATALIVIVTCMIFVTGCYKTTTLVIPNTGEEITRQVSLAADIIPVLTSKCSISGCHSSGGIKPDFSADKVYNTLINGNYVNSATPENSEIYMWLTGKRSTIMPVGGPNNPSNINQFVLAWIKQGAKNN
jgi:hypothetical protein